MNADARRANWRADLLSYGAAGHRSFGDNATAEKKDAEVDVHRQFAVLAQKLHEAKSNLQGLRDAQTAKLVKAGVSHEIARTVPLDMSDLDNEAAQSAMKLAGKDLAESRRYWRLIGEATGTRGMTAVVNNFEEPTDEELIEMGY